MMALLSRSRYDIRRTEQILEGVEELTKTCSKIHRPEEDS